MKTQKIHDLAEEMHAAAVRGFYAAERFGKDSAEHQSMKAAFQVAESEYEMACAAAGIEAYATYDGD